MFSRNSKSSVSKVDSQSATKSSPPSIISADLRISGDLNCDGEIQIDGTVEGIIRAKVILVGEEAHIKGEIVAETVDVHGVVNGPIKSPTIHLFKTAHVVGDILHETLAIETGAFLEGHCQKIIDKKELGEGKINVLGKDSTQPPGAKAKEIVGASVQSKGSTSSSMFPGSDDPKKVPAS